MKNTNEILQNKQNGITLIALVISIIVLLILAGVSIMTLAGDNGLLNRTVSAKDKTTLAEFREEARTEYLAQQIDKYSDGTATSYANLIQTLKDKNKYTIVPSPNSTNRTISSITLSANEGTISVGGTPLTIDVNIEYDPNEDGGDYLLVDGKYYAITESSTNGLEVANEPTNMEAGNQQPENVTIAATPSDTNITTSISGNTITISPSENATKKTSTISVTVNDETFTNNTISVEVVKLSKLKSLNVSSLTIDGASLITATIEDENGADQIATSSDVKWSSSNTQVATVTSNGIVKCGVQSGTATITCTGSDKSLTCSVSSQTTGAKIVYTNSGSANKTITGATTGFGYNNPIIPVGFSAIDTENAKWNLSQDKTTATPQYNNGLVIMDEKGNQFVWVPVGEEVNGQVKIPYAKWCGDGIAYNDSHIRATDEMPANTIDTTTTYGGCWIGRFEAGLDVDMVDSNGVSTAQTNASADYRNVTNNISSPIIVEGAIPWNFISYTNSKTNAEKVYSQSNYAQSGLINGTQWDTALKFIQEKGGKILASSSEWGNHYNSAISSLDRYPFYSSDFGASWDVENSKAANSQHLLRTGASTETKALNISDIAGNIWERTTEIISYSYGTFPIERGGTCFIMYGESNSPQVAYRNTVGMDVTGNNLRFPCCTLYSYTIKLIIY